MTRRAMTVVAVSVGVAVAFCMAGETPRKESVSRRLSCSEMAQARALGGVGNQCTGNKEQECQGKPNCGKCKDGHYPKKENFCPKDEWSRVQKSYQVCQLGYSATLICKSAGEVVCQRKYLCEEQEVFARKCYTKKVYAEFEPTWLCDTEADIDVKCKDCRLGNIVGEETKTEEAENCAQKPPYPGGDP